MLESSSRAPEAPGLPTTGLPLPARRQPETRGNVQLPAGTVVVSADSHWTVAEDLFYAGFPSHLKDRAPRLWTDEAGVAHWDVNNESLIPPGFSRIFATQEGARGSISLEHRLRDLDAEGTDKEIVFGNGINILMNFPDALVREWGFRVYNEHLGAMQRRAPGRFYGVGFINFWDMSRTRESVQELVALGLKTFMLPIFPKDVQGNALNYCLPEMEPMWDAIEVSGLPVCFHVGEAFKEGPGSVGTTTLTTFAPFRKSLGELIFGGIFDRHPTLQVLFAEADLNWVPGALQTAEMTYDCFGPLLEPRIQHRPTYYWHNNCYASFMYDPAGMRLLDLVGVDRAMWASDYPHMESTLGYSWSAMKAVVDAVPAQDAKAMLGGNAIKVFKLDQ